VTDESCKSHIRASVRLIIAVCNRGQDITSETGWNRFRPRNMGLDHIEPKWTGADGKLTFGGQMETVA
jgi:hypothetical protein